MQDETIADWHRIIQEPHYECAGLYSQPKAGVPDQISYRYQSMPGLENDLWVTGTKNTQKTVKLPCTKSGVPCCSQHGTGSHAGIDLPMKLCLNIPGNRSVP